MPLPRALAAGLLLGALVAGFPRGVAAHALVVDSSPRAGAVLPATPARIVLSFNTRLEKALSALSVTDAAGRPVARPALAAAPASNVLVAPMPPLGPGRWVVRWKVLSTDGHVTEGAIRFTIRRSP